MKVKILSLVMFYSLIGNSKELTCPKGSLLMDYTSESSGERILFCQKKVNGKFINQGPEIIFNKDGSEKSRLVYEEGIVKNQIEEKVASEKSGANCPLNYIKIPALRPYTDKDFCVATYEMKNNGSNKAVSSPAGKPWVEILRVDARSRCQELGAGYDLISNDQWQSVARNIAGEERNWDSGKVGVGAINIGLVSGGKIGSTEVISNNPSEVLEIHLIEKWSNLRRFHYLKDGKKIWDFGGNVNEYVIDLDDKKTTPIDTDKVSGCVDNPEFIAKLNCNDQDHRQVKFGAAQNTICTTGECGFGKIYLDKKGAYVSRGGSGTNGEWMGIFSASKVVEDSGDNNSPLSLWTGFRCVIN